MPTTTRLTRIVADLDPNKDTQLRSFVTLETEVDGTKFSAPQPDFVFQLTKEMRAKTFNGMTYGDIFDMAGGVVLSEWEASKKPKPEDDPLAVDLQA